MTISQAAASAATDHPGAPVNVAGILRDMGLPVAARANATSCDHCGVPPGDPCHGGAGGMHLARFATARRRGLITAAEMAAVLGELDVFTAATIIWAAR